jgi:hypothetical protein
MKQDPRHKSVLDLLDMAKEKLSERIKRKPKKEEDKEEKKETKSDPKTMMIMMLRKKVEGK